MSATKSNGPSVKPDVATSSVNWLWLIVSVAVGVIIWFIPRPEGTEPAAWHLLEIFVATIVSIISKPLPMGAVAIIGLTATALTGTLTINEALSGFSNSTIWLIVLAFFISRGFIKTSLGARIAFVFIRILGNKTLGLSYWLIASDLILSPAIPSNTARGGGIIYPIIRSFVRWLVFTTAIQMKALPGELGRSLSSPGFRASLLRARCSSPPWPPTPSPLNLLPDLILISAGVSGRWPP